MINNVKTGTYIRMTENGEESYNFNFYTNLSAYDKLIFVNSVVDTLVDDNSYDSIVRDLIFDFTIVRMFTDIDTSFINIMDDDGDSINPIIPIEQFLEETNIVNIIKSNMEIGLLENLNHAVNQSIEYRTGIRMNPLNDALVSLMNTIEKKINEIDLNSVMEMATKFSGMIEEPTLENIVNAYMNSDAHKKNLIEIEESKKQMSEFAEDMDKAIIAAEGTKKSSKKSSKKTEK